MGIVKGRVVKEKIMNHQKQIVEISHLGDVRRFRDDKLHNNYGPAIIHADGCRIWCRNGVYDREGAPAVIRHDGGTAYYVRGKLHNPHGPAITWPNGDEFWFFDGKRHNPSGPAVKLADGTEEFWVDGKKLTEDEFGKVEL